MLRRLAIRDGALYVFEPNDNAFRRRVQRGFEDLLTRMFAMGAFAGSRPAEAFQVVVNAGLSSDRIGDEGIFLVELRVAPSLPLTFLTIRLIQTGARGTVTEG